LVQVNDAKVLVVIRWFILQKHGRDTKILDLLPDAKAGLLISRA
jgi:hypothetical protein